MRVKNLPWGRRNWGSEGWSWMFLWQSCVLLQLNLFHLPLCYHRAHPTSHVSVGCLLKSLHCLGSLFHSELNSSCLTEHPGPYKVWRLHPSSASSLTISPPASIRPSTTHVPAEPNLFVPYESCAFSGLWIFSELSPLLGVALLITTDLQVLGWMSFLLIWAQASCSSLNSFYGRTRHNHFLWLLLSSHQDSEHQKASVHTYLAHHFTPSV